MPASNLLFAFILTLGDGIFALNVQRLVSYMRIAGPDDRTNDPITRIDNVIKIGKAQTTIFWGFMALTAVTVEILIQGVFSGFSYELILPKPSYMLYSLSQDGFALLVLGAIGFAFFRREVLKPRRLDGDNLAHTAALIILSLDG